MLDSRAKVLERRWRSTGSVADEAAWLTERVRCGDLSVDRISLAAYCGSEAAGLSAGLRSELAEWPELGVQRFVDWGTEASLRVCHAALPPNSMEENFWRDFRLWCVEGLPSSGPSVSALILSSVTLPRVVVLHGEPSRGLVWAAQLWQFLALGLTEGGLERPSRELTQSLLNQSFYAADSTRDFLARIREQVAPWALGYRDPLSS